MTWYNKVKMPTKTFVVITCEGGRSSTCEIGVALGTGAWQCNHSSHALECVDIEQAARAVRGL